MKLTASIATPKTDEQLKEQAFTAGLHAWQSGRWPTACPHYPGSLMHVWWMEGYNFRGKWHGSTFPREPQP